MSNDRMPYGLSDVEVELQPGQTVLVHGAGGGVAKALTLLCGWSGVRVWVTSGDAAKRAPWRLLRKPFRANLATLAVMAVQGRGSSQAE